MINGLQCEKWRLVEEIEEKTNKYTLWIRYKVRIELSVYIAHTIAMLYK